MERQPGARAAAVVAAALLLVVPGTQGGTPSLRCDCARNSQKRSGLFCCRGCPAGHYLAGPCTKPCGNITCLPCPPGTFLARENHHETSCARCLACDEQASQVALENCSALADTHCGCKPGWFMDCLVPQCIGNSPFHCHPCLDCGALHRHMWVTCSSRDTDCGTCLPGFYEYGNSCVSCPTSTLWSCPEPCAAVCGWRQMFWVQVLLAGLVVPLLLGATLTYVYRHCQPCKTMVPADGAGMDALNPLPATHLSPPDCAHTLLVPPSISEKVCTVQLVGNSWTSGSPQTQEATCPEVPWSWDQLPSRALARPAALRRDGRGARAALEGVRAHSGAARGRDRGRGGGGRPLPRPAVRDAQALAPAAARGPGRHLRGPGAHGTGWLRGRSAQPPAAWLMTRGPPANWGLWGPSQKP
ncbi:tumor necrosis factor receptor superfamily member 25 isoform X4 [Pteropus medius]|uniref:tumor necrosis factor receptor superfamily member 25 isoform X4 n=1 Tax=Pteropus vampyrus TaxID=132908 RepID=UPI00196AC2EC|nr:tumor necrosis factor receptor superfamily member 25 isoform X4 [Pteropus giganteus]